MSSLLKTVHQGLEEATDGWRDAPFWDDFFHSASTAQRWDLLSLAHLEPALQAAAPAKEGRRVLVLGPRADGPAKRLAEELRARGGAPEGAEARAYGAEGDGSNDLVVEVGLLDAMAMCNVSAGAGELSRAEDLRRASSRLATLVRPGGTWLSISAVPPALRLPLLGRLTSQRGAFAAPGQGGGPAEGVHTVVLSAAPGEPSARALRGAAQVADMLLYGDVDVHVWAYRLRRSTAEEGGAEAGDGDGEAGEGLLDVVRQQRPGTHDDL